MTGRKYKIAWLVAACVMLAQAVAPVTALAQVSMRCRGMAATASCYKSVVPVEAAPRGMRCALMPCCRRMASTAMFRRHPAASSSAFLSGLSVSNCIVVVKNLGTSAPASTIVASRRHLAAAPSTGPPARNIASVAPPAATDLIACYTPSLSARLLPRVHGLRAPPTA